MVRFFINFSLNLSDILLISLSGNVLDMIRIGGGKVEIYEYKTLNVKILISVGYRS